MYLGLLWAHRQEIQLCLYDTLYLFYCVSGMQGGMKSAYQTVIHTEKQVPSVT